MPFLPSVRQAADLLCSWGGTIPQRNGHGPACAITARCAAAYRAGANPRAGVIPHVGKPVLLAKLCRYCDRLPQGVPTSPALSNIVMALFDEYTSSYCEK